MLCVSFISIKSHKEKNHIYAYICIKYFTEYFWKGIQETVNISKDRYWEEGAWSSRKIFFIMHTALEFFPLCMYFFFNKECCCCCCCCVASVVPDSVRPHRRQPTRLPRPWDSPGKNTGVGCHFLLQCMKLKSENEVAQSCPTLSDPMDCSLPGSSVRGIFQARVLEWGAIALDFPLLIELSQLLQKFVFL